MSNGLDSGRNTETTRPIWRVSESDAGGGLPVSGWQASKPGGRRHEGRADVLHFGPSPVVGRGRELRGRPLSRPLPRARGSSGRRDS